jgi:hypothetical protein
MEWFHGVTIVDKSNPQMALHLFWRFFILRVKRIQELQFSSIGFKTKVVAIEGSFINITLEEEQNK